MGWIIKKWLSYSGVYVKEDNTVYPTKEAADAEVERLERLYSWMTPQPRYKVDPA